MNYEKEMKIPPRFKPPGRSIRISESDAEIEEILDDESMNEIRDRFLTYGLPARLYQLLRKGAKASPFRDERHEGIMRELLGGPLGGKLRSDRCFIAAVFLLAADEWLWDRVKGYVGEYGIAFDLISVRGAKTDAYFLYLAAKQFAMKKELVSMDELSDEELISDGAVMLYLDALLMRACGGKVLEKGMKR